MERMKQSEIRLPVTDLGEVNWAETERFIATLPNATGLGATA